MSRKSNRTPTASSVRAYYAAARREGQGLAYIVSGLLRWRRGDDGALASSLALTVLENRCTCGCDYDYFRFSGMLAISEPCRECEPDAHHAWAGGVA
jgi:hypothetical protein